MSQQQYERETLSHQDNILVEREGYVLIVTLDKPDRLNALSGAMMDRLGDVMRGAGEDPAVRAIVVTGAGKAFCAGADVSHLDAVNETAAGSDDDRPMPLFTPRHCKIYKPSICAVNGMCASAGLHFVADCDIVIASETARFTDTHTNVGQVSAIEPIGLCHRAPLGPVLRMLILGKAERLDAEQARAAHLVSEVLPADQLMPRAMELAHIAASVSPAALQTSLKAVWDSVETRIEESYASGWRLLLRHRKHPDATEGPRAFLQKRAPEWRSS